MAIARRCARAANAKRAIWPGVVTPPAALQAYGYRPSTTTTTPPPPTHTLPTPFHPVRHRCVRACACQVANLCLTPEGTLFSSGIDKMVKVWKPPGSWGEEWHGLRELDLTTAGMVAEDIDRLEKQLNGEKAKWVLLSVSNNYLYDEGIAKLVQVLRNTTAPLETLDLSKTNMTSAGAKLVAQLLAPPDDEGPHSQLPLKKLVLHSNDIDAEGYAAIGAAVRHERCGLREVVVSTHTVDHPPDKPRAHP